MSEIEGKTVVTAQDAATVLQGLTMYQRYPAAALYKIYERQARQRQQEPAHPTALGRMFRHIGMTKCKMRPTGSKQVINAWLATSGALDPRWRSGEWI